MPGLRSQTEWTTRAGKRRRIRLYASWRNMLNRTRGNTRAGDGSTPWLGKKVLWPNWHAFRAWALENGYSRARNSLDRFFDWEDYGPDTCRWLSVADNTRAMTRGVCASQYRPTDGMESDIPF